MISKSFNRNERGLVLLVAVGIVGLVALTITSVISGYGIYRTFIASDKTNVLASRLETVESIVKGEETKERLERIDKTAKEIEDRLNELETDLVRQAQVKKSADEEKLRSLEDTKVLLTRINELEAEREKTGLAVIIENERMGSANLAERFSSIIPESKGQGKTFEQQYAWAMREWFTEVPLGTKRQSESLALIKELEEIGEELSRTKLPAEPTLQSLLDYRQLLTMRKAEVADIVNELFPTYAKMGFSFSDIIAGSTEDARVHIERSKKILRLSQGPPERGFGRNGEPLTDTKNVERGRELYRGVSVVIGGRAGRALNRTSGKTRK